MISIEASVDNLDKRYVNLESGHSFQTINNKNVDIRIGEKEHIIKFLLGYATVKPLQICSLFNFKQHTIYIYIYILFLTN